MDTDMHIEIRREGCGEWCEIMDIVKGGDFDDSVCFDFVRSCAIRRIMELGFTPFATKREEHTHDRMALCVDCNEYQYEGQPKSERITFNVVAKVGYPKVEKSC